MALRCSGVNHYPNVIHEARAAGPTILSNGLPSIRRLARQQEVAACRATSTTLDGQLIGTARSSVARPQLPGYWNLTYPWPLAQRIKLLLHVLLERARGVAERLLIVDAGHASLASRSSGSRSLD